MQFPKYTALLLIKSEWKILFEIFRFRRDDNIKADPKETWHIGVKRIQLIQCTVQWQFLVNTAINAGYIKGSKFVDHSKEATFLRNILLSEFSWDNVLSELYKSDDIHRHD
jgi:hypothetical protein